MWHKVCFYLTECKHNGIANNLIDHKMAVMIVWDSGFT